MTKTDSSPTQPAPYVFDAAWQEEHDRLRALETIWDPYTRENLLATGVKPGWCCLEAGAGGGSVAAWLCDIVRPGGHVTATDLDTRFLELLDAPNLDVRRHDIAVEALEPDAYDLVHARLLLEHLPNADNALRHMIDALKPGGWLVLEEFDHVTFLPDPESSADDQAVWAAWTEAFGRLARQRGIDLDYGRRMFALLRSHGLADVSATGRTVVERGGAAERGLLRLSVRSLRSALIETGAIDAAGVDRLLALLDDPKFSWTSQLMVAAKGRRT